MRTNTTGHSRKRDRCKLFCSMRWKGRIYLRRSTTRSDRSELHVLECMEFPRHTRKEYLWGQFCPWWTHHSIKWPSGLQLSLSRSLVCTQSIPSKTRLSSVGSWKNSRNRIQRSWQAPLCVRLISPAYLLTSRYKKQFRFAWMPLYRDDRIKTPDISEKLFHKMLLKATTEVEFSFNGTLYKQVDGVAMGSPLGPVLANIFVGHCGSKPKPEELPLLYKRFVDDTFSIFTSERESDQFLETLKRMHTALGFTREKEKDNTLPFMDVSVTRTDTGLSRSMYRNPTFTGLYTRWDSFCDMRQKINLVKSLTSWAVKICTPDKIIEELSKLSKIFEENGYPLSIIKNTITKTVNKIKQAPTSNRTDADTTKPNFITVTLPWKGRKSASFRREMEKAVHGSFQKVQLRTLFTTRKAFSGVVKDVLPATMKSNVIYHFTCDCESTYVGRTSQQLGERIKQHLPNKIFLTPKPNLKVEKSDSAITKHLKKHPVCISDNLHKRFKILSTARHDTHLEALEAIYIKTMKPALCQQKTIGKFSLISA